VKRFGGNTLRRRYIAFGALTMALGSVAWWGSLDDEPKALYKAHARAAVHTTTSETPQERRISDGIQRAFGERAFVHCTSIPEDLQNKDYRLVGKAITMEDDPLGLSRPAILLEPTVCDTVIDLADGESSEQDAARSALSLLTVAHEVGHALRGIKNEQRAECFGVAHMTRLATAMNIEPRIAEAGQRYFYMHVAEHAPPEYFITREFCDSPS